LEQPALLIAENPLIPKPFNSFVLCVFFVEGEGLGNGPNDDQGPGYMVDPDAAVKRAAPSR